MAHVLIGFAEALPAPEVVFSLRAAGHQVSAFARTENLPLARLPLADLHRLPAPEKNAPAAVAALQKLLDQVNAPDLILPLDDTALWMTTELSEDLMPRIAGATGSAASTALDKAVQTRAAQAAGLAVPDTVILPDDNAPSLPAPGIARPSRAVDCQNGKLVKADVCYLTADTKADDLDPETPYLAQPLIRGRGEGIFGFATTSGISAWSAHRRLRMMNPHGSGASACISAPVDPALKGPITDFLDQLNWRGPFMIELLRDDDGTPWFVELNGRMWGSMALARRQGLEYPAWSVAAALDPSFVPTPPPSPETPVSMRHFGRDLLHLAFVLRGPKGAFHRKTWPRILDTIGPVVKPGKAQGFYNYDPAHPRYFLRDALWTVRRTLFR